MKRVPQKVLRKARRIKLLLLDVDGVLTDGRIVLDDDGRELKNFDVRDGHGIHLLLKSGIDVGFLSGRFSRVVSLRAKELGVRIVYQRIYNKLEAYEKIKRQTRLEDEQIAYMGDDVVDVPVLRQVGWAVVVRDCWDSLPPIADYVTRQVGGRGAVREVVELLLRAQGKWQEAMKSYYDRS